MLSEKGLLIIEKLAEHNNDLVTSKALAASTGMSERSVKTDIGSRRDGGGRHP